MMPPARTPTRWDPNPDDPAVRRWRENLTRGSVATGDAWFRALRRFCAETEHTPGDLLVLKPQTLRDVFLDFVASDEKRGVGGSYTAYTVKVARSWLRFNGAVPPSGVKIRAADTVFEETALTPEQVRASVGAAAPRERMAILLMATGGVRPEVLGDFLGSDGLTLGDLPELSIERSGPSFGNSPSPVLVRRELSKASHRYYTFLGEETIASVVDYLTCRMAQGEKLTAASSIYAPERPDLSSRRFVRTTNIGTNVRRALRAAGLSNRPYVLRTTAASRFAECENRGLVAHALWQHWLGHKGDMSARYSVNRGKLPPTLLEEMRAAYHRCEPFLSTNPTAARSEDTTREACRVLLSAWYTDAEIAKLDLSDREVVIDALRKGAGKSQGSIEPRQRVVDQDELPRFLEGGWRAVVPVNGSKFVVERPP